MDDILICYRDKTIDYYLCKIDFLSHNSGIMQDNNKHWFYRNLLTNLIREISFFLVA